MRLSLMDEIECIDRQAENAANDPVTGDFKAIADASRDVDELESILEDVYNWLHDGPMDDWQKRCDLHRRIGGALGKPPVSYAE